MKVHVTGNINHFCKQRNESDLVQASTDGMGCQIHLRRVITMCRLAGFSFFQVVTLADRRISYSTNEG